MLLLSDDITYSIAKIGVCRDKYDPRVFVHFILIQKKCVPVNYIDSGPVYRSLGLGNVFY